MNDRFMKKKSIFSLILEIVLKVKKVLLFFRAKRKKVLQTQETTRDGEILAEERLSPVLERLVHNPILEPIPEHFWESKAVFNPAAIYDKGEVHIIYRAVGDDDISTLGYACSQDGTSIDKRLRRPIYFPRRSFEGVQRKRTRYCSAYVSGPGFGGCEDPRITKIDDRFYMIYVAFDGSNPPRLAITFIRIDDFLKGRWNWKKPVLISRPGVIDKNGCILPEKINGKYVIFHRVFPNILIDFVDSLDFDGKTWLKGEFAIRPRKDCWDSRKVGVGATPIKTKDGWLVIYNAVDNRDKSRYKIGAMLLDLKDPTQVLCRSNSPILEPTEHYENGGLKFGVVYPCGAVVIDNYLFVYYGGSDMTVCAASADLDKFLNELKPAGSTRLETVQL